MKRLALAAAIAGLLVVAALALYRRQSGPPEAPAARVARATLVQVLTTNGRVEALASHAVHARAATQVREVLVKEGDAVRRGQLLASVDDTEAREAVSGAQARLEVARADQGLVERGGAPAQLADLDALLARARLDQDAAGQEVTVLERLVERQAAPRAELADQRQKLRRIQTDLAALERKRGALVAPEDRQRVQARIREAEAALAQANTALRLTELRSPAGGILYSLVLRPGAFFPAGALLAQVGMLDKVRVRVLVDEPELGAVRPGQPVRLSWDALPGQSWEGAVERLPAEIEMAGARSVGEVLCTVDNPGRRLLPNVTVNVEIRAARADNTLAVPRAAVAREAGKTFVFTADSGGIVARHPVSLGIQDTVRVQVLEGLTEGQTVLLPGERVLTPGLRVEPKVSP